MVLMQKQLLFSRKPSLIELCFQLRPSLFKNKFTYIYIHSIASNLYSGTLLSHIIYHSI